MTRSPLDLQSELPRSIPLFRYAPDRVHFTWRDWDPALVRSAEHIPQYLVLGDLDTSTFELSDMGWSARWQGTEIDTHFDVAYKADTRQWKIRQTWCGVEGGSSIFPARIWRLSSIERFAKMVAMKSPSRMTIAACWRSDEDNGFSLLQIGSGRRSAGRCRYLCRRMHQL